MEPHQSTYEYHSNVGVPVEIINQNRHFYATYIVSMLMYLKDQTAVTQITHHNHASGANKVSFWLFISTNSIGLNMAFPQDNLSHVLKMP